MEVLLETDPQLALPPEDRLTAAFKGVTRGHSAVLRRGLAEGIALVGSAGQGRSSDGVSADFHATGSAQGSGELVAQGAVAPPGDGGLGGEAGFAQHG